MNLYKQGILHILLFIAIGIFAWSPLIYGAWLSRQWNPMEMLDNFWRAVNDGDRVQETALNDTTDKQWQYSAEFKLANTLDAIRIQIAPYLQWIIYIGLSLAVLGIIYNGFLMVTDNLHGNGTNDKVKKRMINIGLGVWILSWFYVLIQILLAFISYILK